MRQQIAYGIAIVALANSGCTSSKLTHADGRRSIGDLVGAKAEQQAVQLRFEDGTADWIPLNTVVEAERPGTIEMLLGLGWVVGGAVLLATASSDVPAFLEPTEVTQTLGFGALIGGLAFLGAGLSRWQDADGHLERAGWPR